MAPGTTSSEEEGSYFGPPLEWADAQREAGECIESGAEVVGLEEVVGVATLHVSCELEDRSPQRRLFAGFVGRRVRPRYEERVGVLG